MLSRTYRSLFLWSGTPSTVEGPVTRLRMEQIEEVVGPTSSSGAAARKFTVRPLPGAGGVLELQAASPEDAA